MKTKKDEFEQNFNIIPKGYGLYWKPNEVGGRIYFSDEIAGGVFVWDTSIVDSDTLIAAILQEKILQESEKHTKK